MKSRGIQERNHFYQCFLQTAFSSSLLQGYTHDVCMGACSVVKTDSTVEFELAVDLLSVVKHTASEYLLQGLVEI